jgi:hypothetical protein
VFGFRQSFTIEWKRDLGWPFGVNLREADIHRLLTLSHDISKRKLRFCLQLKRSSGAFYLNRMVSDVFVKICQDQKQFEHPFPLVGFRFVSAFFQIRNDRQRVR